MSCLTFLAIIEQIVVDNLIHTYNMKILNPKSGYFTITLAGILDIYLLGCDSKEYLLIKLV